MIRRFSSSAGMVLATAVVTAFTAGGAFAADKPGARPSAVELARSIDRSIAKKLEEEKVPASAKADDAEFLRRATLDITGIIPPADKVVAFLESKQADKREKLLDELLASPQYGKHMADVWQHLLLPRDSDNRRLQPAPFVKWLDESFNANKSWDVLVRELLTATGTQDENGAVTYFLGNSTADKMTDSTARLFLGVQLQCAQCHNHPFTTYKKDDYWAMAAFFMKVRPDNVNKAAKDGTVPGITEGGKGRPPKLPEAAKTVPAKFLQDAQPKLSPGEPYRPVLAAWLTAPKNKFFARALVNRTWAHLFGRGFVNPIDDMHEGNLPSHPELLNELTSAFAASGFDVKYLIKAICLSEAYNRTSKTVSGNETDDKLFSHVFVKPMTPEQLFDSLTTVLGVGRLPGDGAKKGAGGGKGVGAGPREQFIAFFQGDENASAIEYQAGIPQVLRLMNSQQMNNTNAVVNALARGKSNSADVIEQLYLTTLSRKPNADEMKRLTTYVSKHSAEPRPAYGDIVWALLNSSEFAMNH